MVNKSISKKLLLLIELVKLVELSPVTEFSLRITPFPARTGPTLQTMP